MEIIIHHHIVCLKCCSPEPELSGLPASNIYYYLSTISTLFASPRAPLPWSIHRRPGRAKIRHKKQPCRVASSTLRTPSPPTPRYIQATHHSSPRHSAPSPLMASPCTVSRWALTPERTSTHLHTLFWTANRLDKSRSES